MAFRHKLLITSSTFPRSKDDAITARFVFELAKSLCSHYEVYVLAPHAQGLPLYEEVEGLKIYRFQYFYPARWQLLSSGEGMLSDARRNPLVFFQVPLYFLSQCVRLFTILIKERIEVVNSHWIIPQGFIGALARNFIKFKHIVTVHAADIFALKRLGFLGGCVGKFILKRTDVVIPVSTYIKERVAEVCHSQKMNYKIIPMGFNERLFYRVGAEPNRNNNAFALLFIGKMTQKKGLKYLLEALSILNKEHIPFKLNIAGGGPLEKELRALAKQLDLDSFISFLGWVNNDRLPQLYGSCDIIVVPSVFDRKGETEGMPVVVLEAMAMAKPVLASRISGIPDIVKDGYNGWLVEPANSKELARKIKEIHSLRLDSYGENALKTAIKFTFSEIALNYKKTIEESFEDGAK